MMKKGLMMKYFVLSPLKDDVYGKASRAACRVYAKTIRRDNPDFSMELERWIVDIEFEIQKAIDKPQ